MAAASAADLFGRLHHDGTVVFSEDDVGDAMYVIQDGTVEISAVVNGVRTVLCTLGKGDYFGEMALLDSKPRLATATVRGSARLMVLTRDVLLERIEADPHIVISLLKLMCTRIRSLQETIETLKSKGQLDVEQLSAAVRAVQT